MTIVSFKMRFDPDTAFLFIRILQGTDAKAHNDSFWMKALLVESHFKRLHPTPRLPPTDARRTGLHQLKSGNIQEAIATFIDSKETCAMESVVSESIQARMFEQLLPYLQMAKRVLPDSVFVDTELAYSLASLGDEYELFEMLLGSHNADVREVM